MKQRALPQSFWQQPNLANPQPPGIIYSTLPPLPLNGEDATDMTPVEEVPSISSSSYASYSSSSSESSSISKRPERFVSTANTDLLFSLFNTIEEEEAQRRIHIVRRGRYTLKQLQNRSNYRNSLTKELVYEQASQKMNSIESKRTA